MSGRRIEPVALAAGLVAVVAGTLLALDQGGTIDLSTGWIAALLCAAAGLVLIVGGAAAGEK